MTQAVIGLQRTVISAAGGTPPDWVPLTDLFVWGKVEEKPRPPSEAGAALLRLIELDLLPGFAADGPWLEKLAEEGASTDPPPRLCWAAKDAILLAPYQSMESWGGFLIARASSKGQTREFADEKGQTVILTVPKDVFIGNPLSVARANTLLTIAGREN